MRSHPYQSTVRNDAERRVAGSFGMQTHQEGGCPAAPILTPGNHERRHPPATRHKLPATSYGPPSVHESRSTVFYSLFPTPYSLFSTTK
jgi:hypothetical protein